MLLAVPKHFHFLGQFRNRVRPLHLHKRRHLHVAQRRVGQVHLLHLDDRCRRRGGPVDVELAAAVVVRRPGRGVFRDLLDPLL